MHWNGIFRRFLFILELAVVCIIESWTLLLLCSYLSYLIDAHSNQLSPIAMVITVVIVFGSALVYGRKRRIRISTGIAFMSLLANGLIQLLLFALMVKMGMFVRPELAATAGLLFLFVLSGIVLLVVRKGSLAS